jgi:hypothetical protein
MPRLLSLLTICVPLAVLIPCNEVRAAEPRAPIRGVLVRPERVTPGFLAARRTKGATAIVVPLDESMKRHWKTMARIDQSWDPCHVPVARS